MSGHHLSLLAQSAAAMALASHARRAVHAVQASRSRQGKMEKSLLSFAATYPTWEPDAAAKQMLMALGQAPPLRGGPGNSADMASMQSAVAASLFPGAPRLVALCHCSPISACGPGPEQGATIALREVHGPCSSVFKSPSPIVDHLGPVCCASCFFRVLQGVMVIVWSSSHPAPEVDSVKVHMQDDVAGILHTTASPPTAQPQPAACTDWPRAPAQGWPPRMPASLGPPILLLPPRAWLQGSDSSCLLRCSPHSASLLTMGQCGCRSHWQIRSAWHA